MKLLKRSLIAFFVLLLLTAGLQYLLVPVYDFQEPKPFHGDNWYNPYEGIKPDNWGKYNFQVQSKAWLGLTDGHKNSNERIDSVYSLLGYDYVATSDYQKIDTHHADSASFIPTYEHGYNPGRIHQVCIGAKEVIWQDFVIWQNKHVKQWVLDNLQETSTLVAIAHPRNDGSYSFEDLSYLSNYDLMEVLNNIGNSVDRWDAALSAGKPIWILGNDDAHDVLNTMKVGRRFTMINSKSSNEEDVLDALKSGAAYGVKYLTKMKMPMGELAEYHQQVPIVEEVKISGDTLMVSSSPATIKIDFIGQGGRLLHSVDSLPSGSYILQPEDTYVRAEIHHENSTILYLNPVVRSTTTGMPSNQFASVNKQKTQTLRLGYWFAFFMIGYFMLRKVKIKLPNVRINRRKLASS